MFPVPQRDKVRHLVLYSFTSGFHFSASISSARKDDASTKDFYEILGVSKTASFAEIKEAFYRKSKEIHPDTSSSSNSGTEAFVELKKAYDTLRRPADRRLYDYSERNRNERQTNRNRDVRNPYNHHYYNTYRPDGQGDWRTFWQSNPDMQGQNARDSEHRKRSDEQWKVVIRWTLFGTFLVVLYNVGYLWMLSTTERRLRKLNDEDEIAKSFMRQAEFRDQEAGSVELRELGRILKADVDEAWRRRCEDIANKNKDEIREEHRWMRAVQDFNHTRKNAERKAEMYRRDMERRWGRDTDDVVASPVVEVVEKQPPPTRTF